MKEVRAIVHGTNVVLSRKRGHSDGVLVQCGQIVRETAVHVTKSFQHGGQKSREKWDERRTKNGLLKNTQYKNCQKPCC